MSSRPTLGVARACAATPVLPQHRLALVGEAPPSSAGAGWHPLDPAVPGSAAARLAGYAGLDTQGFLDTFARANLLGEYPGPAFPVARARPLAEPLCQQLAPRPLLLLGRGVAMAFSFPREHGLLDWVSYRLGVTWCCAAVVPHPSGRNLWYNDPANRDAVRRFVSEALNGF